MAKFPHSLISATDQLFFPSLSPAPYTPSPLKLSPKSILSSYGFYLFVQVPSIYPQGTLLQEKAFVLTLLRPVLGLEDVLVIKEYS